MTSADRESDAAGGCRSSSAAPPGKLIPDKIIPDRIVIDTNVWLDLLWFRDPALAALNGSLLKGELLAVVSSETRAEWHRVLSYPELRIASERHDDLNSQFDRMSVDIIQLPAIKESSPALPRCADPDDQMFLQLARSAGVRALLSRDSALLALAKRCARDFGFIIMPPTRFVSMLTQHSLPADESAPWI